MDDHLEPAVDGGPVAGEDPVGFEPTLPAVSRAIVHELANLTLTSRSDSRNLCATSLVFPPSPTKVDAPPLLWHISQRLTTAGVNPWPKQLAA